MEHIPAKTKFNIRNKKGEFPYQCSANPAIRDLFYRTYVANSSSDEQEKKGIAKLSQKLKYSCDQYRIKMVDKYKRAQERADNDKKQIISSFLEKRECKYCECKGCQGCQHDECQYNGCHEIAKYFCRKCKEFRYCDNCIRFNSCECKEENSLIKIEYIPLNYEYPDFNEY